MLASASPAKGPCTVAHNLTRSEAQERSRLLDVESYGVELDLTGGDTTFGSASTVVFRCASPGASTFIDLIAPEVRQITLNGEPVSTENFDGDRIRLDGLAETNELQVIADCAYSRSGEGLHRFTDPADGAVYLYSDLETFDAHRVYACFDQPDLKSSFQFTVTAPEGWQVLSNMPPETHAVAPLGKESLWEFPPTPLLPTYITAIVAGPYHTVRSEHDGIPLGIYCRQSLASYLDPDEIFEITRQGLDFFHGTFGVRYPFAKYDQVFVPEFKAGAMENAGCVTFLEAYVFRSRVTDTYREARAETILHEMAHMWFGDLVTMRWWDDLWLNESFATWASNVAQAEATRWNWAWTTFAQAWKAWAYRQDQLPSTHPISADIPDIEAVEVNFDGITYAKGASVLKQLVAHVGRENFVTGLRRYFDLHAWGNATLGDLLTALEESSGRNLSDWSKRWLESAGVNTLRPDFSLDLNGAFTQFTVVQEAPASHPVLRPHRIAIGLYSRNEAGLTRQHRVELDIDGERTEVPGLAGLPCPDLVLVNDDDLTYAKLRLDDASLRTLVQGGIGEFTDSLAAALCLAAAWDMCRDAEMPARDYIRLIASAVGAIKEVTPAQTMLRRALTTARRYADPSWRAEGLELIASTTRDLLERAEPGSDLQLAYAQVLADVAFSDEDLALLAGLLDGSAVIDGLVVDTELRWQLLYRLVSRGAIDPAEIDTELERDSTDAGARHAATCRAAIPDPEAKDEAWRQITSGTLSNATFRATLDGLAGPDDDEELLAPYALRFFAAISDVWRDWSSDMAQYFAENAYPSWRVSQETIADTDAYTGLADPPAGLARLLAEARDDVARALRCRARDAGSA
jgi:aminopeptidase N